jgi:hypothetical protein
LTSKQTRAAAIASAPTVTAHLGGDSPSTGADTHSVYRDGVRTLYASAGYADFMAASYPNPPGRPPNPQRRRRNIPKSYGAAVPTTAPAAKPAARELGIDGAHPLIAALWDAVQTSCEATFYSDADWVRLRLELQFANHIMASGRPSARAWDAVQHGLNEMLLSPAVKRRAGIELRRDAVDADMVAADEIVGKYKRTLRSV